MSNQLIYEAFEKNAATKPGKTAIKGNKYELSYEALNEHANRLARILQNAGISKEQVIAFFGPSGIEAVASMVAIFKAAGIYMPVDKSLPLPRVRAILKETGCRMMIIDRGSKDIIQKEINEGYLQLDKLLILDQDTSIVQLFEIKDRVISELSIDPNLPVSNLDLQIDPDDANYIFYTSGSTGQGKPILGCHKSLAHFIHWEINEFELNDNLKVGHLANLAFDASLRDIWLPLAVGGTLFIPEEDIKFNTIKLIEWIEATEAHLIHIVPSMFRLITKEVAHGIGHFNQLKYVFLAGEKLYAKDINTWRSAVGTHVELVNLYGTSETTMAKTFHRIKDVPDNPSQAIHAGKAIDNAFIIILNSANKLCRIGEMGEIYIKTPYRSKGYYNDQTSNEKRFVQNPLVESVDLLHKTGDLGRYGQDREIEVIGRKDDQVKVNGIRVELNDIQECLLSHDDIEEAIVVVNENADKQSELVGYYRGENLEKEALRAFMMKHLSEKVVPGYLIQVDEFLLTPNGKIDKKSLPKINDLIVTQENYEKVHDGIESELEYMWKDLLGLNQIGRTVSFFEIGGNSLKSIQLISKIYKSYNVLVKINEIFALPTIASLADHIEKSQKLAYKSIPELTHQEHYDLSHAQKRFWTIHQVGKDQASYNVPGTYKIKGKLDIQALDGAIRDLVNRHEILRTTFMIVDGAPKQRISARYGKESLLNYRDLRGNNNIEKEVNALIRKESNTIFDLEEGLLFKVSLFQTKDQEYIYAINMHHIISDGWSLEVLAKEMMILYDSHIKGQDHGMEPLNIQYKDYADWHNQLVDSLSFQNHRQYWLGHLSGPLPRIDLKRNLNRTMVRSNTGKTEHIIIGQKSKQKLQDLAKKADCSLFMVGLALLNTLIYKYSKQEDILIGSPVAGREHPDLEDQVGLYINTLLLRNKIKGEGSFEQLLQVVKKNTIDALKFQSYPLDLLVDELDLPTEKGRNALFDVGFTYFNEDMTSSKKEHQLQGLEMEELNSQFEYVKADLWVKIVERQDDLIFVLTYASDLFSPLFAERLISDFKFLIEQVPMNHMESLDGLVLAANEQRTGLEKIRVEDLRKNNLSKLKSLQTKVG